MDGIFLKKGAHENLQSGACAMEWVAWVAGEPHSDAPQCVSPVIGAFARKLNDALPDDLRQRLIPLLLDSIGTNSGQADDLTRAYLCADWAVRVVAPLALDRCGKQAEADRLRNLARIVDVPTAQAGRAADAAYAYANAANAAYAAAAAYAAYAAAAAAYAADAAYAARGSMLEKLLPGALDLWRAMNAVGRNEVTAIEDRADQVRNAALTAYPPGATIEA